ncbi:RrF2 family transcriptional regulator [Johnsonella ignava]|uniref:RrF2 family transcriptional regulator n=1 Tax=Johnsonella ignava TaxID=43995 RepID=UPI0023F54650|nr:Rrf2 family transcriptional regulator [Johnsonella ignava]
MKISTKGRYAIKIMIDLAENQKDDFIPLRDIASRQNISEKYLESIIKILVKNKMLLGLRGKGGGYKLVRNPDTYTIADILKVSEDSIAYIESFEDETNSTSSYKTIKMWNKLNSLIDEYLSGITIADLICEDPGNDYVI